MDWYYTQIHITIIDHVQNQLKQSLIEFPCSSCVSSNIKEVIYSVHKEFSLVANYAKGHGQIFRDWFIKNHAGNFFSLQKGVVEVVKILLRLAQLVFIITEMFI